MPRKYGPGLKALPGFRADPEKIKAYHENREERGVKKLQKNAEKALRAEGFEFGKFKNYVKNFTK